ncbi:MAG: hypothetical protein ACOCXA_02895 [Planctomycetota bacterium]
MESTRTPDLIFSNADEVYASGMVHPDTPRQAIDDLIDYCKRHGLLLQPGMAEASITSYMDRSGYRICCTPRVYLRLARRTGCYRPGRIWFEQLNGDLLAHATGHMRDNTEQNAWSELSAYAVQRYHHPQQHQQQQQTVDGQVWDLVPLEMLGLIAELRVCKRAVEDHPDMREHHCDDDGLRILSA